MQPITHAQEGLVIFSSKLSVYEFLTTIYEPAKAQIISINKDYKLREERIAIYN